MGGKGEEDEAEKVFDEIMPATSQIWQKTVNLKIQEFKNTLNSTNPKKSTSRHSIVKFLKTEDKF